MYERDMAECSNSEPGWFNAECGRPAAWIGTRASGNSYPYCERCKEHGYEARGVVEWSKAP